MSDPSPVSPDALAALRGEIDTLDDQMHALLMRRAEVVARLAASGIKRGAASPLRPGREALILRRLLARHAGTLPRAAVVRLWREIFATSSAMQGGFTVAVHADRPEQVQVAREHFGIGTPLRSLPTAARALAAVANGEAQVAVLPLPEEGEAADRLWWASLEAPRLQVVARLPFYAAGEPVTEALAVTPGAADPSGADRTLIRIEAEENRSRSQIAAALTAAGLPPGLLQLHRGPGRLLALAEVAGFVQQGDPRLADLGVHQAIPLGSYAVPERGDPGQ
jgi:chorismate mutase